MYYCGIDLGSKHSQVCIIDADDQVLYNKKLRNQIDSFVHLLKDYGSQLKVLVESTFNWDWIVDGLQAAGIHVELAHAFGLAAITSAKVKTDKRDAHTLARLLRVDMVPTAYIYPLAERGYRDLLRHRIRLIRQRSMLYTKLRTLLYRFGVNQLSQEELERIQVEDIERLLNHPTYVFQFMQSQTRIQEIQTHINSTEELVKQHVHETRQGDMALLQSIPGVGEIMALTILYEIGDIHRFASVKKFSSYARVVPGCANSSGKQKKGRGNKQGNPFLKWAFTLSAQRAAAFYPECKAFREKHMKRHSGSAQKLVSNCILAHRLAAATYHILKKQEPYKKELLFAHMTT